MAGETISPLPVDMVRYPSVTLEKKVQIYPTPEAGGGGAPVPTSGQVWPRGA
jgi:hypothetical protein